MEQRNPHLRMNPGGSLKPEEVVGRGEFIASVWRTLERQSVLLTSERRLGKTSVMVKMFAEPPAHICPIRRSLQGITSPDQFVKSLIADVEAEVPGLLGKSLGDRLRRAGIRKIAASPLLVEFEPASDQSWKDVASETFAALDSEVEESVVFFWDEVPHMVADIRDNEGPLVAREILDVLRASRERHPSVRMVLSGSLGIHHVVADLRTRGGMWVPTHDMLAIDLPALNEEDAAYLARELLHNESFRCDDPEHIAHLIAQEVDCIPYYIHHTILQLWNDQNANGASVDVEAVERLVEEAVNDPLDRWQLRHYVDRIPIYYGKDADLVRAILDVVALAPAPPSFERLCEQVGAFLKPPTPERMRGLIDLLRKDYYLGRGPDHAFLRNLVRRAWIARRSI